MNTITATPSRSLNRLVERIQTSDLFHHYGGAFERTFGLKLAIEPANPDHTFNDSAVPVNVGKLHVATLKVKGDCSEDRRHDAAELLKAFAFQLGECAHRLAFTTVKTDPEPVRLARAYMQEHLHEPISLDDVAHAVGVSSFHFCKVFKRATGMTFTDYLGRMRVERARRMLLKPSNRITEVAYEAGFQSLSHFNRSFRRVVGESPTEFRARLRNNNGGVLVAA
ncbi:MAG: helix-turn-helix transcriptional regulator [Verrucomicrobiaceae bacterium]|nr:helix-turn-helix transcriptional regulator [Verrucomicrobiaceae bacterium]